MPLPPILMWPTGGAGFSGKGAFSILTVILLFVPITSVHATAAAVRPMHFPGRKRLFFRRSRSSAHTIWYNCTKYCGNIGGSQGGQQALTWSVLQPALAERLVLIACNLRHSAWGIAFNETQRMAIASDPSWGHPHKDAGLAGLSTARAIALLSYRNYTTYSHFQADEDYSPGALRRAATYQRHQGSKLCRRFNAWSYWYLSQAMDTHNAAKGFSSAREALRRIQAHTLLIGIHSDLLFPPAEQAELARLIPRATLRYIDSVYGHDGFLTETAAIQLLLNEFYNTANQ